MWVSLDHTFPTVHRTSVLKVGANWTLPQLFQHYTKKRVNGLYYQVDTQSFLYHQLVWLGVYQINQEFNHYGYLFVYIRHTGF